MPAETAKSEYKPGEYIAKRYEVKKVLGKGGMGMVYLVLDHKSGETIALKTIRPEYTTSGAALHRFGREVRTIRKLNHPGIVRIRDAFRCDRLVFYTMDYVKGWSLRDIIRERSRLGLGSTTRILALVADALQHAHQFTIHRDLSPENVMVLADGSIRLLDFGLAKLTDTEPAFTRIGVTLGKHPYLSPEQLISAADVDHRTDIYALGVMFYEMLTGQLPEDDKTITGVVPTLPESCDIFYEKATAKSPDARFATAGEFRKALLGLYRAVRPESAPASQVPVGRPVTGPPAAPVREPKSFWERLKALFRWRAPGKVRGND
ncbi:MAG TPA: serine/threonine-protein kinase [Candidatus Hydrogenedentes bacterium]|nr:serine/threonine-protein kinase [Candidatus Hydrogenedentota bacterium]HQM49478.1 serine/threonine-protein kinase [Candidatus Hydrogenedentota bacterium]